ncbi:hypothetical protein ACUNV4_03450 [Granulosicoccus sp. 3-233]|uniref:hypothetical protein n=1 Tax=Granulosicoccus sp. 3-233 TaxID=3417969 RepID=UPI003D33F13E
MASPVVNVTLLAPGFGRDASTSALRWSNEEALQPWQSQFCKLLAQNQWNETHLPVAELLVGRQRDIDHESGKKEPAMLICADPVHLRADRDTASLVPAAMLSISDAEADALLGSINEFLAEDELQLWRTDTAHWYMRGRDGRALLTFPPEFLSQRNASAFLPEGEAAGHWKRLLTELQMLLHSHPVNAERQQRGLMPINSLWFWGGAPLYANNADATVGETSIMTTEPSGTEMPLATADSGGRNATTLDPTRSAPCIHADEPFAVELARHLGLDCRPLAAFDPARLESQVLIVDRRLERSMLAADEAGVLQARQRIEQEWVDNWRQRVQDGENLTLDILDEDGMHGRLDSQVLRQMAEARDIDAPRQGTALSAVIKRQATRASLLWRRLTGSRS